MDNITTQDFKSDNGRIEIEQGNGWVTIRKTGNTPEDGGGSIVLTRAEFMQLAGGEIH